MKIACLHTAESNIAIYDAAAKALGLPADALYHHVRADLLFAAEEAGGLTPDIEAETASVLQYLAQDADAVVLNCSTLGPAALLAADTSEVPVVRADGVLAQNAVKAGGKVVVLCTTETTIAPTTRLFEDAAKTTGADIYVRLIDGAWTLFRAGEQNAYLARIAEAAKAAYREGARTVVFAQASMTAAPALLGEEYALPLSGPAAALEAAMTAVVAS
ncbi:aspartate/glutamate racemase family protein [Rhizobium leucaenae]|uniref:Asp/Glu/hydantoin racemase n=1 Tax=Rhizobium leucaenae TaxID=29450 RepID=A0A7W6ZTH7_9HYPH|nr:aspartate/glutamate racemase family protein [Rhizobium leucaenae]MBB4568339.1 Asp/Glu/hydantoin racemase [Rhizobium leucaenae]MBB6300502.1 Asp/Glu/hydantoin racemase [Rhizobium leucaenae]